MKLKKPKQGNWDKQSRQWNISNDSCELLLKLVKENNMKQHNVKHVLKLILQVALIQTQIIFQDSKNHSDLLSIQASKPAAIIIYQFTQKMHPFVMQP